MFIIFIHKDRVISSIKYPSNNYFITELFWEISKFLKHKNCQTAIIHGKDIAHYKRERLWISGFIIFQLVFRSLIILWLGG